MSSFKDFLRCYKKKDVVPTLEAMQKKIAFYHVKVIDILKLGCTLPNLANICLYKSSDAKFCPFTGDKTFWRKFEKMLLVVHLSFSQAKQILMKLLSESLQTNANLLLGLMPANYIPTVSTHAYRPLYALGFRFRNEYIHTSTKQDSQL